MISLALLQTVHRQDEALRRGRQKRHPLIEDKPQPRSCMKCHDTFTSKWKCNRLCPNCSYYGKCKSPLDL